MLKSFIINMFVLRLYIDYNNRLSAFACCNEDLRSICFQSPWFWDTQLCWENFENQEIQWPEFIYYMMECSFYLSLLCSIMTDIKRKVGI